MVQSGVGNFSRRRTPTHSALFRVEHSHWSRLPRYCVLIGGHLTMQAPRYIYAITTHFKARKICISNILCLLLCCFGILSGSNTERILLCHKDTELCLCGIRELTSARSQSWTWSASLCLFIECYQSVLQVLRHTNVFAFDQSADFCNTASKN